TGVQTCALPIYHGDGCVLVLSNMTPVPRHAYRVGVPYSGPWREIVNTDAEVYGGSGMGNGGTVVAEPTSSHGRAHSLCLTLPPLCTLMLIPEQAAQGTAK